jgi:hypothetical protein
MNITEFSRILQDAQLNTEEVVRKNFERVKKIIEENDEPDPSIR